MKARVEVGGVIVTDEGLYESRELMGSFHCSFSHITFEGYLGAVESTIFLVVVCLY